MTRDTANYGALISTTWSPIAADWDEIAEGWIDLFYSFNDPKHAYHAESAFNRARNLRNKWNGGKR